MRNLTLIDDDAADLEVTTLALKHAFTAYRIVPWLIDGDCVKALGGSECPLPEKPDLILLDYMLGLFTAEEIIPLLRHHHPQIPLVVITSATSPIIRQAVINAGANDCWSKPFTLREARSLQQQLEHLEDEFAGAP